MKRLLRYGIGVSCLLAVALPGISGAYDYLRDYDLHRGFSAVVHLKRAGRGRLLSMTVLSKVLHRPAGYLVYLPPHYSRKRRYPVFYLLHGMPGKPRVFVDIANMDVRLDNQLSLHHLGPMILVYPDGRIDGSTISDSEWANTPSGHFESYVLEVMHDVDRHFNTLPSGRGRVIGGFSAGAYGAINIALHHPSDFRSVQVWSGYFDQQRAGVFSGATRAALHYNSPRIYAARLGRRLARYRMRVFMFVGRGDRDSRRLNSMISVLRRDGVAARQAVYRGGHDWAVWYPRLNAMLELAWRDVVSSNPFGDAGLRRQLASHGSGHGRRGGHSAKRHHRSARGRPGAQPAKHHHRSARGRRGAQPAKRHHPRAARAVGRAHRGAPGRRAPQALAGDPNAGRPGPAQHHGSLDHRLPAGRTATGAASRPHNGHTGLRLLGALLLALLSGALINFGFILQHRGHAATLAGDGTSIVRLLRNRAWLLGQGIGWVGFAAQIVAIAFSPLTLVQAFYAGSLALSVPLAAHLLGHRLRRSQCISVALIGLGLASLTVGFSRSHGPLQAGPLLLTALLALGLASVIGRSGRMALQAVSAGILYGIADAVIKAATVGVRADGVSGVLSGWTILAAVTTFAGFLTFQAALRHRDAVRQLTLMNAFTAISAVVLGVAAFGEPLGRGGANTGLHLAAIALVLACIPSLVGVQQELIVVEGVPAPDTAQSPSADAGPALGGSLGRAVEGSRGPALGGSRSPAVGGSRSRAPGGSRHPALKGSRRPMPEAVAGALLKVALGGVTLLAMVLAALIGFGWLYLLRSHHLLALGPRIQDSLPLLQLAGFSAQPALRVIGAWLVAGGACWLMLHPLRRGGRSPIPWAVFGVFLMLLASDASFALARNLRFGEVLQLRTPPLGAWVEGAVLALAAAISGHRWRARSAPASLELPAAAPQRLPSDGSGPSSSRRIRLPIP